MCIRDSFQAIVGSVIYLAQVTRYDILFAVNQLARAITKPSKAHMAAAKHLLRYLAGIPTQNQLADLGTKFLATPRLRELISKIQAFGDNAVD